MNQRKKTIILIVGLIVLLVSVFVVLVSRGLFQQDVEYVPKLPVSGTANETTANRPKKCVPLPETKQVSLIGTRTPTPAPGEAGMGKVVLVYPTLDPNAEVIDLNPESNGNDKFKVVVFTCDGKTKLYYGISEADFNFINKQLRDGDVILDMESPASLMQREMPEPELPE